MRIKPVAGTFYGKSYATHFRHLDVRLGRWKSTDPVLHSWQSPYASMDNNPVILKDPLGDDVIPNTTSDIALSSNEELNDGQSFNITDKYLIRQNGEIEREVTDDDYDEFFLEQDDCSIVNLGKFDKNSSGLIALPTSFNGNGIGFSYTGSSNENYISGPALAALFGALNYASVSDLSLNHWSNSDGTSPAPSKSHVGGNVGDLRPLRLDKSGAAVLISDDQFDKSRNTTLVAGLMKYGWTSILSEEYKGYITPGATHFNKSRHNNHFHIQKFKPQLTIVEEVDVSSGPTTTPVPDLKLDSQSNRGQSNGSSGMRQFEKAWDKGMRQIASFFRF